MEWLTSEGDANQWKDKEILELKAAKDESIPNGPSASHLRECDKLPHHHHYSEVECLADATGHLYPQEKMAKGHSWHDYRAGTSVTIMLQWELQRLKKKSWKMQEICLP